MMRAAFILAAVLAVSGCTNQAESSTAAGVEFQVDRLFTHDQCTVYRFRDGGTSRYFARCEGTAATGSTTWRESCGKNCSRDMGVPGSAQ